MRKKTEAKNRKPGDHRTATDLLETIRQFDRSPPEKFMAGSEPLPGEQMKAYER